MPLVRLADDPDFICCVFGDGCHEMYPPILSKMSCNSVCSFAPCLDMGRVPQDVIWSLNIFAACLSLMCNALRLLVQYGSSVRPPFLARAADPLSALTSVTDKNLRQSGATGFGAGRYPATYPGKLVTQSVIASC